MLEKRIKRHRWEDDHHAHRSQIGEEAIPWPGGAEEDHSLHLQNWPGAVAKLKENKKKKIIRMAKLTDWQTDRPATLSLEMHLRTELLSKLANWMQPFILLSMVGEMWQENAADGVPTNDR